MNSPLTRRLFLLSSAQLAAGGSLLALTRPLYSDSDTPVSAPTPDRPPKPRPKAPPKPPALANACWDWGGGDFETPLQAAAHTGGHAIAEYLLGKGARLDVYAAAMLGQLDFIKAVLALDPKAHEILHRRGLCRRRPRARRRADRPEALSRVCPKGVPSRASA